MLFFAFNSVGQALLIMMNVPLALIGGIASLYISEQYLSVPGSIGFIALFVSAQFSYVLENGMGAAMKEAPIRLIVVEHPLMMILAITLITMGFSKHKKQTTDNGKFKTIAMYYGIALLFVLSRIPWSQWLSF